MLSNSKNTATTASRKKMTDTTALTQYLSLYESARGLLAASSPSYADIRDRAYKLLSHARLPRKGDEGYEKTSIEDIFAPDYGVNIGRVDYGAAPAAQRRCAMPAFTPYMVTLHNDVADVADLAGRIPQGIAVMSLAEAVNRGLVKAAEVGSLIPESDTAAQLNNLLWQDGIYIKVDDGVVLDRPLQVMALDWAPVSQAVFRRMLVHVGAGAAIDLVYCLHSLNPSLDALLSEVTELYLSPGASLNLCVLQETSSRTDRVSQTYVSQSDLSSFSHSNLALECRQSRSEVTVIAAGADTQTRLYGMVVGHDAMHVDCSTVMEHRGIGGMSDQLFKYALDDRSTGAFEGTVKVCPGARLTRAYQNNRNILASKDARMHSKPQLEIYNDDVQCSHGAATGQLDADALFYMQTRGIPLPTARLMLMRAFMAEAVEHVRPEELRDRLRHIIDMRMGGDHSTCYDTKCPSADD